MFLFCAIQVKNVTCLINTTPTVHVTGSRVGMNDGSLHVCSLYNLRTISLEQKDGRDHSLYIMASQSFSRSVLDSSMLNDLITALEKCGLSKRSWSHLGIQLGLKKESTLEEIEYKYPGDASKCLTECLSNWLKNKDDVDSRGGPTLNSLICALEQIGENAVADKMSKKGINCSTYCNCYIYIQNN